MYFDLIFREFRSPVSNIVLSNGLEQTGVKPFPESVLDACIWVTEPKCVRYGQDILHPAVTPFTNMV